MRNCIALLNCLAILAAPITAFAPAQDHDEQSGESYGERKDPHFHVRTQIRKISSLNRSQDYPPRSPLF